MEEVVNLITKLMKTKQLQQLVAIAGFFPAVAFSQFDTAQKVTFTLTESSTAPALIARDGDGVPLIGSDGKTYLTYENEFSVTRGTTSTSTSEKGSKIEVKRISNKEILEALVEAEVITSITGYSISFYMDEESDDGGVFHLVKAGSPAINIGQYLYISDEGASAENETERSVITTNTSTDASSERYTRTAKGKTVVDLRFVTSNVNVEMSGVANWSDTYRVIKNGPEQRGIFMPGAASVTSIVGESLGDPEDEEDDSLLEGRISMSAGAVLPPPVPITG